MAPADQLATIDAIESIECGNDAAQHFGFAPGYLNLNHGSYGACPTEVRSIYRSYQDRMDARPDAFTRYEYRSHLLDESRQVLSDYLNVPLDTCVLVPNVSTAFDTIVRNLIFQPGDVVVCFDIVYESFEYTLQFLAETTSLEYVKIACDVSVSDEHICKAFEDKIKHLREQGKNPRMAVFDTISSLPAVRWPFERLTGLCHKHGILSCIDGAHGIGQLDIDLASLDPDFFTSNLHKWFYVPRPCAVLYVPQRNQHMLRSTLPTGFGFLPRSSATPMEGKAFAANFQSVGTLDDSPYLSIKAALDWRRRICWNGIRGEQAIMGYLRHLATEGGQAVAKILDTEVLNNQDETLTRCAVTNVRLPLPCDPSNDSIGPRIMRRMMDDHNIAVVVLPYRGHWWVRLSAQVYLTVEDFQRCGEMLRQMCERTVSRTE